MPAGLMLLAKVCLSFPFSYIRITKQYFVER
jgi:hypothetical protein